ncbi:MAG: porin family protein [Chitinophagales bacterium]
MKAISKSVFALILCVLLSQLDTKAQITQSIGVTGGFASSGFHGESIKDVNRRNLYSVGMFYHLAPGKGVFSIQPEIIYVPKGGVYTYDALQIKEEYQLNYLEIPVMVKISIPIAKRIYPHVFAGPQIGIKLSEKYEVSSLSDPSLVIAGTKETEEIDYGGVFGAGVDFKIKKLFLGLNCRYYLGANEVKEANEAADIKNGTFSMNLGLGVKF